MAHRYAFAQTPVANPQAIVGGGGGDKYRLTVLTDGLLRLEWAEDGQFEDRASVLAIHRALPVPEFRVKDSADGSTLEIITARFHLTYDKKAFSPSGCTAVVKGNDMGPHSSVWRYGDDTDEDEQEGGNLRGTARTLDKANGRIALEKGILSRTGYATLDDSESMLFDADGWLTTRRPGTTTAAAAAAAAASAAARKDVYLFAYGRDYRAAIKALYALSGAQPLIPRWALGNWWSRYYSYEAQEFLALVDRFRAKGIPLSMAVLDMGWHLVDDDPRVAAAGVSGWTGYTWNEKLFPDPRGFLAQLHSRGLRTSLNDHPADGVHSYEEPYEDMARALQHDTSHGDPIAFDITNRAFTDAFFDVLHRRFEKQGVDLWWVDWQQGPYSRTPGIDPLWVLNHFHFLDSAYEGKRPLTFSRYAGPGSHRYPVGFSGDTYVTWESLHFQPEFTATASNIGFGWWSHDIGGHMHGFKNDEMLIRWVQLGVFSPILRLHSSNSPWSIKEPWNLDLPYELIMSDYLRLRHRLVPYLYTMSVHAAVSGSNDDDDDDDSRGLPLVQPMYWAFPTTAEAYEVPNQFLFGTQLLVAPITRPMHEATRRAQTTVWLPAGRHVDIFTGAAYDGDRKLVVSRKLSEYPVFAREGAIVPLDGAREPRNDCAELPGEIELLVVVGADGKFTLVEDDGCGSALDDIVFHRTPISFSQQTGTLTIGPVAAAAAAAAAADVPPSRQRTWSVRFVGLSTPPQPVDARVNGAAIRALATETAANGLIVRLGAHGPNDELTVHVGPSPQLDVTKPLVAIQTILADAQIELDLKEAIWAIVEKTQHRSVQAGQLLALDLPPELLHPLLECLIGDSR